MNKPPKPVRRRLFHAAADAHDLSYLTTKIPKIPMASRPNTVSQALLVVEILSLLPMRR